jgi:hypothetical protein
VLLDVAGLVVWGAEVPVALVLGVVLALTVGVGVAVAVGVGVGVGVGAFAVAGVVLGVPAGSWAAVIPNALAGPQLPDVGTLGCGGGATGALRCAFTLGGRCTQMLKFAL